MFSFAGRDFIILKSLERADLEAVVEVAREMEKNLHSRTRVDLLHDKLLGLMFFQVSTQTRTSHESAMQQLGGEVAGFADKKGTRAADYCAETPYDTVRMMESYADILVIRHPQDFAPAEAAAATDGPVINAGDGYNEHLTQAMLDLYTIKREKGQITGLNVGLVGDMNIRGNHSLALGLAQYMAKA